jgi:hypothetical protein
LVLPSLDFIKWMFASVSIVNYWIVLSIKQNNRKDVNEYP